ncbi:hypothetical protein ACOMHN_040122 [Nucella lapillus]
METPGTPTPRKIAKPRRLYMEGDHPSYTEMIITAVTTLNEHGGSSAKAILNFMFANYELGTDQDKVRALLKTALQTGVQSDAFRKTKRTGRIRLGERTPENTPMRAKIPESEDDEPTEQPRIARPLTRSCFRSPTKNDVAKKAPKPPAKKAKKATKPSTKTAAKLKAKQAAKPKKAAASKKGGAAARKPAKN